MDFKTKIRVFAFPIDDYDRSDLDNMDDVELADIAYNDDNVEFLGNLYDFETMVNDEEVLSQYHWIKFINVE